MAYMLVTGSTSQTLANAVATASWDGWLIQGGVVVSASTYVQAMIRADGTTGWSSNREYTQSLNSSFPTNAVGTWAFAFPSGASGIPGLNEQPR